MRTVAPFRRNRALLVPFSPLPTAGEGTPLSGRTLAGAPTQCAAGTQSVSWYASFSDHAQPARESKSVLARRWGVRSPAGGAPRAGAHSLSLALRQNRVGK